MQVRGGGDNKSTQSEGPHVSLQVVTISPKVYNYLRLFLVCMQQMQQMQQVLQDQEV